MRFCLIYFLLCFNTFAFAQEPAQENTSTPDTTLPSSEEEEKDLETPEEVKPRNRWRFAVGLLASSSGNTKFKNAEATVGSYTGPLTIELNSEPAYGVLAEAQLHLPTQWGFNFGIEIESYRDINDLTISSRTSTAQTTFSGFKPRIRSEIIYANAVFRWTHFYILGGPNASIAHYDYRLSATEEMRVAGGIGGQLGAGLRINEMFELEALFHLTGFHAFQSSTGSTLYFIDYKNGFMQDFRVFAKFLPF